MCVCRLPKCFEASCSNSFEPDQTALIGSSGSTLFVSVLDLVNNVSMQSQESFLYGRFFQKKNQKFSFNATMGLSSVRSVKSCVDKLVKCMFLVLNVVHQKSNIKYFFLY